MYRFILALTPGVQAGDPSARIEAGRDIADRLCSRCHAIDAEDEGRHEEAPPLRGFAHKWPLENLEEALAEGIMVGRSAIRTCRNSCSNPTRSRASSPIWTAASDSYWIFRSSSTTSE